MMGMTEKAEVSQADAIMLINKISRPPVTPFTSFRASSERSEGSLAPGREMLRCSFVPLKDKAQHDKAVTFPNVRIIS
jgi:hypothetical protein